MDTSREDREQAFCAVLAGVSASMVMCSYDASRVVGFTGVIPTVPRILCIVIQLRDYLILLDGGSESGIGFSY